MSMVRATVVVVCCAALVGCVATPPAAVPARPVEEPPVAVSPLLAAQRAFERDQRERALGFARQKRPADAALAWEVLIAVRPDVGEYRRQLADTQHQIDVAVAERLPRAAQAAQRGDIDSATQQYLAVLALQPRNDLAADALRNLDRERNKRNHLGKFSRNTITRRAMAEAEMKPGAMAGRNEIEHAALLAGDGELDDAIALLERRLAADRRDAAAQRLLAHVYGLKAESLLPRDKAGAVAALEKSVRLDPADARAAARLRQVRGGAVVQQAPPAASAASPKSAAARPTR